MRNPQLEYADGDRPQAREQYEAIRYTIDTLERRTPGSTKSITRWTTRRCRDGKLVGVPAPMRVREARRALEDQRRAWSAS